MISAFPVDLPPLTLANHDFVRVTHPPGPGSAPDSEGLDYWVMETAPPEYSGVVAEVLDRVPLALCQYPAAQGNINRLYSGMSYEPHVDQSCVATAVVFLDEGGAPLVVDGVAEVHPVRGMCVTFESSRLVHRVPTTARVRTTLVIGLGTLDRPSNLDEHLFGTS